jgi:3',5'-nucleoside bisphosphate phosphatase
MGEEKTLYYDFHLHSCLSPCGDADMTPNNIVNMAKLKGLDAIALTDHNSCGNCGATMRAGARGGLIVLPGMELCTSEDIHVVCLFAALDGALAFENEVRRTMPVIKNRPEIFGEQLLLDDMDNLSGSEDRLLIAASGISVDNVLPLCRGFGGTAFPAHADKPANGIIQILGTIPPECGFASAEISTLCDMPAFLPANPSLRGLRILRDSDAHYLWDISDRQNALPVPDCTGSGLVACIDNIYL